MTDGKIQHIIGERDDAMATASEAIRHIEELLKDEKSIPVLKREELKKFLKIVNFK